MKTILNIMGVCVSLFFLGAAMSATAIAENVIIGAENAAGLWGREDGTGCGNDIVTAAFKAANFPITLEVFPYIRAKKGVLAGDFAGCFSMSWDDSFKEKIIFADQPLYTVTTIILERNDDTIAKIEDLQAGMVVGTVRGYEYPASFTALQDKGIIFEETGSEAQNLQKLLAGRVRVAIVNVDELKSLDFLFTSSEALKSSDAAGKLKQAFVVDSMGAFVGFSLMNKNGLLAKQAFDQGFAIIKKNGTYDQILAEWKKRQ